MDIPGKPYKEPYFLSISQRIVCALCVIPIVYYLLMCYFSFSGAFDDWHKFKDLGFSYSFQYHLNKNDFLEDFVPFLCAAIEFVMYIVQYHRAEKKKPFSASVWYFSFMLVIHAAIWLHASSLLLPDSPPYDTAYFQAVRYRRFARMTILPSVAYFLMYLLRIWINKSKKNP